MASWDLARLVKTVDWWDVLFIFLASLAMSMTLLNIADYRIETRAYSSSIIQIIIWHRAGNRGWIRSLESAEWTGRVNVLMQEDTWLTLGHTKNELMTSYINYRSDNIDAVSICTDDVTLMFGEYLLRSHGSLGQASGYSSRKAYSRSLVVL